MSGHSRGHQLDVHAIDPKTRLFYVMAVENCFVYRSTMFGGGRGRAAAAASAAAPASPIASIPPALGATVDKPGGTSPTHLTHLTPPTRPLAGAGPGTLRFTRRRRVQSGQRLVEVDRWRWVR